MMDASSYNSVIDFDKLETLLKNANPDKELFDIIVNAPFVYFGPELAKLFLGIMTLVLVNKQTKTIDRIALTTNDIADHTERKSKKRFEDIKIPLHYLTNIIAKAIDTGRSQSTDDWQYLFIPELTAEEARLNQADGGIAFSVVYPLKIRDGGAIIFSYYQYPDKIGKAQRDFMRAYSRLVSKYI